MGEITSLPQIQLFFLSTSPLTLQGLTSSKVSSANLALALSRNLIETWVGTLLGSL